MSRNFRSQSPAGSGFFAFQDIITIAIALMVLVILILTAGANNILRDTSETPITGAEDDTQLKAKLAEIMRLESELAAALRGRAGGAIGSVGAAQIKEMEKRVEAVRARVASFQKQQDAAVTRSQETERARKTSMQSALANAQKELARLNAEIEEQKKAREAAEENARDLDNAIALALKEKKKLWVIPEKAHTTKTPVFGVVSSERIRWSLINRPNALSDTTGGDFISTAVEDLRAKYRPLDFYVVLYFKPSGISHFRSLTVKLRAAGYELGYDAIAEETDINFGQPQ
ncbi:MAG: hypothetical protein LBR07_08595 [Puniceicoccales bacterium]|jgi:beta-glucosidase-like glycosyl hydrolase|nr:hypothetical protein [Puniceicoccales bacterium]